MKCSNVSCSRAEEYIRANRLYEDYFSGRALRAIVSRLPPLLNRRLIDMGCGDGRYGILFALLGAEVVGVDISEECLSVATSNAREWGVADKCIFSRASVENLPFEEKTFDVVFSRSVIQYTDRSRFTMESLRVLKEGGTLVWIQNLPMNPFLNVLRVIRSRDPKSKAYVSSIKGYLTYKEILNLKPHFSFLWHNEYHFCDVWFIAAYRLFNRNPLLELIYRLVQVIDIPLISIVVPLRRLCWQTSIVATGKQQQDVASLRPGP